MMRYATATEPGSPGAENEDWHYANHGLIVVLDGATTRTDTGCIHGVSWYASHLGQSLARLGLDRDLKLGQILTNAIALTADEHRECDLRHPGTPSATVAMLRISGSSLEYLVLGDTTVIVETGTETQVLTDDRVDTTAQPERAEADRYPIGSPEKRSALIRMKHAELAVRNQPGGYWVAAADPMVATHALSGEFVLHEVRRVAVLTDGAARVVSMFDLLNWSGVLDVLTETGPTDVIRRVRAQETADPNGTKWPRNKASDDATVVFATA
jgi:serine/threonine protein phosphatase PrpC